jgi:hypothetical protein
LGHGGKSTQNHEKGEYKKTLIHEKALVKDSENGWAVAGERVKKTWR